MSVPSIRKGRGPSSATLESALSAPVTSAALRPLAKQVDAQPNQTIATVMVSRPMDACDRESMNRRRSFNLRSLLQRQQAGA